MSHRHLLFRSQASRLRERALAVVITSFVGPFSADAQAPDWFGFQGHVFDKQTLRPVEGAYIQFTEAVEPGGFWTIATPTDGGGSYRLEIGQPPVPPTGAAHSIFALCDTTNGLVIAGGLTYSTLRNRVYRRDFYVSLPKGQTQCLQPTARLTGGGGAARR